MLPETFLDRMRQMLGEEYEEFLNALQGERHQALRLNTLKPGAESIRATDAAFALTEPVPWAENGYYYETQLQPGKHPFHEAGLYYIQEPSAMAPAELLEVSPGDRVLDLCAAPGGKSTQLAAKLQGKGILICNEIHPARAKILSENVERMGLRNACVVNEAPERLQNSFPGFFDRILVDAPCSGEGMFRKNEMACEEWSPENVRMCAARQDEILDCAAGMLRSGGRLVYSTCTFAVEEDEGSVERFLSRHSDFRLVTVDLKKAGLKDCAGQLTGTVRLMPHKIRGEGHFAAVLEKEGASSAGHMLTCGRTLTRRRAGGTASGGGFQRVSGRELGDYLSFCNENLRCVPGTGPQDAARPTGEDGAGLLCGESACYVRLGDHIYLVPPDMPDLKGLRVLRCGLHLGELKKNRFEPSHALALTLPPEEAVHVLNMKAEDPRISMYLNGGAFPAEGEKGWYLICVDGFSLGWGKLSAGSMKNHYPKGLRLNRQPE